MSVELANESGAALDEQALADLARFVLDRLRIHPLAELSLLLVDVETMAQLHQRWMDEPGPTDVMAFPMDELRPPRDDEADEAAPGLLGDVVLCPSVAEAQALAAGHSTQAELDLLTTHGILHLLGYDHADPEGHAQMFALQDSLVVAWREHRQG